MLALSALGIGFLIQTIIQISVMLSGAFLWIAGAVLSWVCSENFISLPYTSGPVVETSWALVRDFTNMLFIVILVFIGLATALRIRDYEAKKTLPLLIIIALLINFTPVICGFIVDAANILMNFFLKNVSGGEVIGAQLRSYYSATLNDLLGIGFFNPLEHLNVLLRGVITIIFNITAGFIFFAFAFLFVIRYVAIWVLVILSPLAFFSYILPATRKVWNMWWNQFIQWVFIGVTGGFFLYLGMQTIIILSSEEVRGQLGNVGENWLLDISGISDLLNSSLSMGIGLAFLMLAFFMGLSTGAMGGGAVMGALKRGGKAVGTTLGSQSWTGIKKAAQAPLKRVERDRLARAYPTLPLDDARKAYKANTSRWQRAKTSMGEIIKTLPSVADFREAGLAPKAAGAGIGNALRNSAKAGWKAAIKSKRGKKGQPCVNVNCKKPLPADADFCPNCGVSQP
jgi:hypothetical protein